MKSDGWRDFPRWEWEKSKKVVVFALSKKLSKNKYTVIQYIQELLKEFSIPLDVIDGNSKYRDDFSKIKKLISSSTKNNKIYYKTLEQNLRIVRKNGRLQYGVILIVEKGKVEVYPQEAIYGAACDDGLIILRYSHKEAVIHELGHMLGIHSHCKKHPDCVMNYECPTPNFCKDCINEIKKNWTEEIKI